jgi:hypothetical protein
LQLLPFLLAFFGFCIHLTWPHHPSRRDLVNFTVSSPLICPLSLCMCLFSDVDW